MAHTIQEYRDAHAALSRSVRFKPPGGPVAMGLEMMRNAIDELEEWQKDFGSIDEWRKEQPERKAADPGQADAA